MPRKMNASERRRAKKVEELVSICHERGLTSYHLAEEIDKFLKVSLSPINPEYNDYINDVNEAGLIAQLNYLVEVLGVRTAENRLKKIGGVLDAIVLHSSSSPKEIEEDLGRNNVDETGDVR